MTTATVSVTAVTVTDRAARRISQIAAGDATNALLRVSVEGGGCSGFQYKFDMVGAAESEDIVLEKAGARVLIDKVSLDYLAGAEIDFVDDLMGASFRIRNPECDQLVRMRHEFFIVT